MLPFSRLERTPKEQALHQICMLPTVCNRLPRMRTKPPRRKWRGQSCVSGCDVMQRLYTQRSGELEFQSSRRRYLRGSNEYPPATVSSYTVVVSHLAFGTLSLRSINAPRWRRSWNVWISCSQDGPQGSQHLIRFSVGHFALAQGNSLGDIVRDSGSGNSDQGCQA